MYKDIPEYNHEEAYKELKEVFDHPCIEKALRYAASNAEIVYGKNTEEYKAVYNGFFSPYFSALDSNSAVDEA